MSATPASRSKKKVPTYEILINLAGPKPGFSKIPEMTEGDTVRVVSSKPVTITFAGLSPFRKDRRTNTSIPDGVVLTVVRNSESQPNKKFKALCRLDSDKTQATNGTAWAEDNSWGADLPVRKPAGK
jgi:hypothetical protein